MNHESQRPFPFGAPGRSGERAQSRVLGGRGARAARAGGAQAHARGLARAKGRARFVTAYEEEGQHTHFRAAGAEETPRKGQPHADLWALFELV